VIVVPRADEVVAEGLAVSARSRVDAHAVGAGAGGSAVPRRPGVHPPVELVQPSAVAPLEGEVVRDELGLEPARGELGGGDPELGRGGVEVDALGVGGARGGGIGRRASARGPEEAREPPGGAAALRGEKRGTRRGGGAVAAREGEDAAHAGG